MASLRWLYDAAKHVFSRGRTAVGPDEVITLRNAFADSGATTATDLAAKLAAKEITLAIWQADMALLIRNSFISSYALGRGGVGAFTDADRTALGEMIGKQMAALRDFSREIATGSLTEEGIAQRAQMYPESAIEAHTKGQAAARGIDLPSDVIPPVHVGCRCHIDYGDGSWGFVTAADDRVCEQCLGLASEYQGRVAA